MKTFCFNQKTAIVTGSGSGIGRALCLLLAKLDVVVCCTDIDQKSAQETADLIGNNNGLAFSAHLDITDPDQIEATINYIVNKYGKLDLMFNNAGIAIRGEIRDLTPHHWEKVMNVNFFGMINGSKLAYLQMIKQGSGHIINTASTAGLVDYLLTNAPYSVSKHAIVNYSKILREEAKDLGVRVSVVCPGFVKTNVALNSIDVNAEKSWENQKNKLVSEGMDTNKAAQIILKGVAKNKERIIFPFSARLIVWIHPLLRPGLKMVFGKELKIFRKKYRLKNE
jgi:NAD(P)-dependent dehydrogenase (short-subunit alcohol dehydrogenase family)